MNRSTKKLLIVSALVAMLANATPSSAGEDQTVFDGISGYAGGKGCDGGKEGQDESASGELPSQHSVEKPGGGWAMAAVAVKLWGKLKGCEATYKGQKIKVMDTCRDCKKNGKIDINHNACDKMDSSNAGRTVLSWTNCNPNLKYKHPEKKTKN